MTAPNLPLVVTTADRDRLPSEQIQDIKIPSLGEFLAWVRSAGLQKNNRFFVDLNYPVSMKVDNKSRNDSILACEEISIPPKSIQTRTLRIGGLDERRATSLSYGGDFTLSFIVDSTHEIQWMMEKWMNLAVNPVSREVGEYHEYTTDVDLWFLRPFNQNELYRPLANRESGGNKFLDAAKERILNLAASEVGKFKTRIKQQIETSKQTALGNNLNIYNRIKGVLPLELLVQDADGPSDFGVYRMTFRECFPVQINRSSLNQGGTDVFRINVQFAFKEYYTNGTQYDIDPRNKEDNFILNFVKRAGLPTSPKGLARQIINLL